MSKSDEIRLRHMHDAACKILAFTQDRTREDLDTDELLALATVRLIEILGEAAKNVSPSIREQSPDIPWRQIAGTRDRLSHAYFDVNLDVIWQIVTADLPPLVDRLEQLLSQKR
ncbi:MAG: DUF86 domain-containing protein [Synechococcus sp.]